MKKFTSSFADFIIRFRVIILVVSLMLTIAACYVIAVDFSVAQNLKDDLPPDDPQIITFEKFLAEFGDAELLVVGIGANDAFSHDALSYLKRITDLCKEVENVQEVLSLTNAMEITGADGVLNVVPFLPEDRIPTDPVVLTGLAKKALGNRFWVNNIVSAGGDASSVNMKLSILEDDATYRFQVVDAVQKIIDDNPPPPGIQVHFTGVSVFGRDSIKAMKSDMKNYIWLMPVMILFILFLVFRTFRGVLIPQVVVLFSVCYTLALMFLIGKSITMISTMLPVLIGVISISDVIHILARYYEEGQTITDRKELVRSTIIHMMPPCFLTSTTTAAGFASLMVSDLTQVRDFGMFSAIGLILAFFIAMSICPIILSFLPVPKKKVRNIYAEGFFNKILKGVTNYTWRDRTVIPIFALLIFAYAIFGISHLKVETQLSKFLPQHAPSVTGLQWLQDKMAGVSSLEMTLEGDADVFKEPWALAEVEKLEDYLESLPEVDKVFSLVDFIKIFNKVLHDDDPVFERIPETRQAVAQYLLLLEMTGDDDLLESFINGNYSHTRISARIMSMGSHGHLDLIQHVQDFVDLTMDKRLKFEATGMVVLYATITNALVKGQLYSLIVAFIIITGMMIVYLKSVKIGLLSMIPNAFPIAVTLGMMGLMGITLNVATVMIACIALGIAVDDTIHYLSRYGEEIKKGCTQKIAMERTMMGAGRGMIFTSVVITGGFFILIFSSFLTNRAFGILTAITMITAVFADMLLLPVMVKIFRLK